MSTTRQPLLTEEQIQEMLEYAEKMVIKVGNSLAHWIRRFIMELNPKIAADVEQADVLHNRILLLAFLRGKTKRVLNIARLRADVKAWVDDPNRKWPEYLVSLIDFDHRQELASDSSDLMDDQIQLCMFAASIIGINPDDYFEEVILD